MKNSNNFRGFYLLMALVAITTFSFGQKYTGLTAVASNTVNPTTDMFDGNMGTRWQDASNLDDASFVVDLGEVKNIGSIKIYWEGANAKDYTLSFSTDNSAFSGDLVYTNLGAGNRIDIVGSLNIDCRYIKLQGVARQLPYGYSIYEFEVYPAVVPVLTSLALTPATSSIVLGETKQLAVNGLDQIGNPIAFTNTTAWSVDGTGASIDANGLFTSTQKGLYTVTATNTSISKTATIDVLPTNANLSIAVGVTASASSGNAALAFNNDMGNRWESSFSDPQWIMVDFGSKKNISDILIAWEGANAKDYIIESSINGVDWTTQITKTAMPEGGRIDRMYSLNFEARYVRLTGTARNLTYGYSIWEFKIYGTDSVATAVSEVTGSNSISVYPNPATDRISVSSEVAELALYSLQGQLVHAAQNTNTLDVSTFTKGLYIVRLTDKVGNKQSTKLEIR